MEATSRAQGCSAVGYSLQRMHPRRAELLWSNLKQPGSGPGGGRCPHVVVKCWPRGARDNIGRFEPGWLWQQRGSLCTVGVGRFMGRSTASTNSTGRFALEGDGGGACWEGGLAHCLVPIPAQLEDLSNNWSPAAFAPQYEWAVELNKGAAS